MNHNIDYILNNTNNQLLKEFILLNIETINCSQLYQDKNNILHILSLRGLDEILEEILKYKIIIQKKNAIFNKLLNSLNEDNLSPLHCAAIYGYVDVCNVLLKYNANINIRNDFNNTPVHYAIINGHVDVVELFINFNCNLQIKNNDLQTPYKLMFKYLKSAVDKLLDKKVKIVARISSCYKKNATIIEEHNLNINREKQIIYCNDPMIVKENDKIIKYKYKKRKNKVTPNQPTFIQLTNLSRKKHKKQNDIFKQPSKKDQQVKLLSSMNIKERKLLVEYDYTEINDQDIIKFINKGDLEIITNPWFVVLMNYYWETFAKKIFISQFIISIIYMILFFISSTLYTYNSIYFKNYYIYNSFNLTNTTTNKTVSHNTTEINLDKQQNFHLFQSIYIGIDSLILLINTFYLVNEFYEITKLSKKKKIILYFFNRWNLIDNAQIFMVYATIILKKFFITIMKRF